MKNRDKNQTQEDTEYSISELYYLLRKHTNIVLISVLTFFVLSIFYTISVKKKFKSSSVIMLSQDGGSMSMLDMNFGNDRNYIENEIEVLKSLTISKLTVEKLISSNYSDNLYLFGTNKTNTSIMGKFLDNFEFFNNDSDKNENLIINNQFISNAANELKQSIEISNRRNTDIITVSIASKSPTEASLLVNTLIDVYKSQDVSWASGEMTHIKDFLNEQIAKKESELNEVELKLKEFQEREKIFSVDSNSQLLLQDMMKFESEYNNSLIALDIIKEKEVFINNYLTSDEKELSKKVSNTINQRLSALKNEMSVLEVERISTINKYGEAHSAVSSIDNKLSDLKNRIDKETQKLIENGISVANPLLYRQSLMDSSINLQSVKSNLKSRSIAYKKIVDEYEKKLTNLPQKLIEFSRLERLRSVYVTTYGFMSQRLEEARIGEASSLGKIRVIDKAEPITKPIKPDNKLNIFLGLFAGIAFGIGMSIVIELFDGSIKSINQVERRGLTILTIIPSIGNDLKRKKNKKIY